MNVRVGAAALGICLLLALAPQGAGAQTQPPVTEQHEDALTPPPPAPSLSSTGSRGPSQYMAGSVAVRVVLPESVGHAEDWSAEQINLVSAQIQAALDWWAARLPLAHLSFTLRLQVVPSAYEPIEYGLAGEGLWLSDTLSHMGFTGASYFDQAYAADAALRDELGTNWATTIFVANSTGRSGGTFPDGRFAYAYINGPFMVLTSDVGSYGKERMSPVAAHELGHIFGALDQYALAQVSCSQTSGYLNTPTTNSQYNSCGTHLPSIMIETIGSFSRGEIDPSALAQLGYRDSDNDGIIDPLDTTPQLILSPIVTNKGTGRPILGGLSYDVGFPSPHEQAVSINTISAVEYRVDGGAWQPITTKDLPFEVGSKIFASELPLYDGSYSVEICARNSAGIASAISALAVNVSGIGPSPSYSASAPALTANSVVSLQLSAPEGTQAVQISGDPSFSDAQWETYRSAVSTRLSGHDGKQAIYVRYRDSQGRESQAFGLSIQLDTTPPEGSVSRDPANADVLKIQAHDDGTGVAEIGIQIGSRDPLWLPFQTDIQLSSLANSPSISSNTPVSVLFRDAAGNTSSPYLVTAETFAVYMPLVIR